MKGELERGKRDRVRPFKRYCNKLGNRWWLFQTRVISREMVRSGPIVHIVLSGVNRIAGI